MEEIPCNKAQLISRAEEATASWMKSVKEPVWRAVRNGSHTIHIVSDRPFDALTRDLRKGLRIMKWMTCSPLTWYWWDHDWTRVLPAHTDPGRNHVNGGWAFVGGSEVHVYRREEAHKVLIHEIIHAIRLDVVVPDSIRMQFHADLGRQLWPHLGEAFTEFFAEWLWAIFDASSIEDSKKRWASQLACSKKQAMEVWSRIHDSTDDEDTNVFAYYVLKWVLMNHQESVVLGPQQSVALWFDWWKQESIPVTADESTSIRLGMTCASTS